MSSFTFTLSNFTPGVGSKNAASSATRFGVLLIVFANIFASYMLIRLDIKFSQLLALYAVQGICIILLNAVRIASLKKYSTDGFQINGRPVSPGRATKVKAILNMLQIFLTFEIVYIFFAGFFALEPWNNGIDDNVFRQIAQIIGAIDWAWIAISLPLFAAHHLLSFASELRYLRNLSGKDAPNLGAVIGLPLRRILPMHLTIIFIIPFALLGNTAAVIFMTAIKTGTDVYLYKKGVGHV
jgi:hypothetical protein